MSPRRGSKPRLTDRLVVGRNVTLTSACTYIFILTASFEGDSYIYKKNVQPRTPPYIFLAMCLVKYRDKFGFSFWVECKAELVGGGGGGYCRQAETTRKLAKQDLAARHWSQSLVI
jgi:hypothetical protein